MTTPRLVHVFPAFSTGGPEVRTAGLINALTGFTHAIVSLSGEDSGRSRLASPAATEVLTPGSGPGWKLSRLGRTIASLAPDLVVTYGWGGTDAIVAARMAGHKCVLHVEDGFLPDEAHGQKPLRLQARRVAFRLARALVVPSMTLEQIARRDWWLPGPRVHFVPNGIDTTRFRPATPAERAVARTAVGAGPAEVVFGTVAALRPDKNHARLIRAFAAVASTRVARLVIVGDGPCRDALHRLAIELGVASRVSLPGGQVNPSSSYHAMDVFALSSDTEQMPLSVLEAMASALPVVSPDVGDVAAMVTPSDGLVTAKGDEAGLASALGRLADDEPARRRVGLSNRTRAVEAFGLQRMTDSYRALYERYLAPRGEP